MGNYFEERNSAWYKVHPISALVDLMVLFTVTTLLQSVVDRVPVNKVVGALIVALTVYIICRKMKKLYLILIMGLALSFVFSMFASKNIAQDVTEWIYYVGTVFILLLFQSDDNTERFAEALQRKIKWISWTSVFCCCIILFLIISKIGYLSKWGEGTYFVGLCNAPHTMASVCCLLLSLIAIRCRVLEKSRWFYILICLIPIYAILETGARIFLVPAMLLMVLILRICVQNKYLRIFAYVTGLVLIVFLMLRTSMMEKIFYSLNTKYSTGILDAFTSGRSRFWKLDLEYYLDGNILELIFGRSFSSILIINKEAFDLAIGAHNDIIYLLNGAGIVGAGIYLYVCSSTLAILRRKFHELTSWILLCIYMFVPMLMNGFFTYQHYVYSFVMLFALLNISSNEEYKSLNR